MTSTRRRPGAQTRKWTPPSGASSAPTGRRRRHAGLSTLRSRIPKTAPVDGALIGVLAARTLSTIVGDHGEGSSIREGASIASWEIDEMEADPERLPADIADSLAAHDLVASRRRVRLDGTEQAVHRMD